MQYLWLYSQSSSSMPKKGKKHTQIHLPIAHLWLKRTYGSVWYYQVYSHANFQPDIHSLCGAIQQFVLLVPISKKSALKVLTHNPWICVRSSIWTHIYMIEGYPYQAICNYIKISQSYLPKSAKMMVSEHLHGHTPQILLVRITLKIRKNMHWALVVTYSSTIYGTWLT